MNEEQAKLFAEQQEKTGELLISALDAIIAHQKAMLSLTETSKNIKSFLNEAMVPYQERRTRKKKLLNILYAQNLNDLNKP